MPIATITDIMESWPIGLRLQPDGSSDEILVDLTDACRITCQGREMAAGELQVGMRVRLDEVRRPMKVDVLEVL